MEGPQAAPNKTGPTSPLFLSISPLAEFPLLHANICAGQLVHAEADPTSPCKFPAHTQQQASVSPAAPDITKSQSSHCKVWKGEGAHAPQACTDTEFCVFSLFCVCIYVYMYSYM